MKYAKTDFLLRKILGSAKKRRQRSTRRATMQVETLENRCLLATDATLGIDNFGGADGWDSQDTYPRFLADVDGDGQDDIVGFGGNRTFVSLSNGDSSFTNPQSWIDDFTVGQGWANQTSAPRFVQDVNGDDRADIIGIQPDGIFVSVSLGTEFSRAQSWSDHFGGSRDWPSQSETPRMMADVNGDGLSDILGFGANGVDVSLSRGSSFTEPARWVGNFGAADGWNDVDAFPRRLADVNGDGKQDIVGFGGRGTLVSLAQDESFSEPELWIGAFGERQGWTSQDQYPRYLADMNGDGLSDIVGFGGGGTFVSLSTGQSFDPEQNWIEDFGERQGWTSLDASYRVVDDVNGDGMSDVVGFGSQGTYIAESTGNGLKKSELWVRNFNGANGWSSQDRFPRQLADIR